MTKIRSRDSSNIQDRRGRGGGIGGGNLGDLLGGVLRGGGGSGRGMKAGGGIIGVLVVLAVVFVPNLLGEDAVPSGQGVSGTEDTCDSEAEQILCGATEDVQEYWIAQYPESFGGREYPVTETVFFSGVTNTGCGRASSQTGPFYCPADELIYFDLDFLAQLQRRFEAPGDLAAQYIVAHEYGHHIQNALGISTDMRRLQEQDPSNAQAYSVALELQADCLAGAWAQDAESRGLFESPGEVDEALTAAAAVGDDAVQEATQGRVDPETWTHGSSQQRVRWFRVGYDSGDPNRCDTFADPFSL